MAVCDLENHFRKHYHHSIVQEAGHDLPTQVMSCRARTRHTYDGTGRSGRMA